MPNSWYTMSAADRVGRLYIYDDIGLFGISAATFIADLKALGNVSEIRVHISSNGGDVYTGLAIYNALKAHSARIIVQVDGIAASMASSIAMAGDHIVMPANTFMMIHDPVSFGAGTAEELAEIARQTENVAQMLAKQYADRSGKTVEDMREIMARTSFFTADEAVEHGFADEVVAEVEIAAKAPEILKNLNAPPNVVAALSRPPAATTTDTEESDMSGQDRPGGQQQQAPQQDDAVTAERTRSAAIIAECTQAGMPDLAAGYIAENKTVDEVRALVSGRVELRRSCQAAAGLLGDGADADALMQEFIAKGVGAEAASRALLDRVAEANAANAIVSAIPPGGRAGATAAATQASLDPAAVYNRANRRK